MSGEEFEFFAKVFGMIQGMYPEKIIDIDGGNIIPIDERTKFMFSNILGADPNTESYYFMYDPRDIDHDISENRSKMLRQKARMEHSRDNIIFVQTVEPSQYFPNSEKPVTEALVELLTMLYFKALGYMVQRAIKSHGGVDDVVVWKSALTDKLREYGFIDYGCYVNELSIYRTFGKIKQTEHDKISHNDDELIIIEAESCLSNVIKNDGGMNQLIGRDWNQSNPDKYVEGAKGENAANRLYITFPAHFPIRYPNVESFEDIVSMIVDRNHDQKVGIICWETEQYWIKESDQFKHNRMIAGLKEYENYSKRLLLENFYFEELLLLMQKMNIDFKGNTKAEVFYELEQKVKESDGSLIISELNKVL